MTEDLQIYQNALLDEAEDPSFCELRGEVEVCTDKVEGRQRQISARIQIPHPVEKVWQVLTDYDHLADFIPSLATSQKIEHPQGGIRLEQVGTQSFLKFKFCAKVVLDMVEQFPHQLDFNLVEGDFKKFFGSWILQPSADGTGTELCYSVCVLPPLTMPVALVERHLKSGLVMNLSAVRQRAETMFG
jgi:ribosome-associated toxin RatA of RatAB toxin-antitoxin module